jgi:LmbE family N-acetylglucosaminyl deacetylase
MWQRLSQRLSDPVTYRKHGRNLVRRFRPPRSPRPTGIESLGRGPVLAVIAHPDDELFASALICELTSRSIPVHIACLTRGEGGITGGQTDREGLGQLREAELRASAAALGVTAVTFLGHVDPVARKYRVFAPPVPIPALTRQIAALIDDIRPSSLITHGSGGEYWHPAHLLTHTAVRRAQSQANLPCFTLHAWQPDHAMPNLLNRDDPPDLTVDGAPHRERRLAALRAHRSQADYFTSLGAGSLEGFLDRIPAESYCHYPAV